MVPVRGRRRGVVPSDLCARVDQLAFEVAGADWAVRFLASKVLPGRLGGLAPSSLSVEERAELGELYEVAEKVEQALEVLERAGYGRPAARRARCERAHGSRRGERIAGLRGKLPRSLAKRLPVSADTHLAGRNDGDDVYGSVRCSQTLRAGHLGLVAAAGGIWHSRNREAFEYAATTAGELAQLLTGRVRPGGKDVADVHRRLADLERLGLEASVNAPPQGGEPREELVIPGPPIERVERLLPDGRWVAQGEYARALAQLSDEEVLAGAQSDAGADRLGAGGVGGETVRIYLARWVRDEIANGRPTLIDFRVWAHLRPVAQRIYPWLQATHRDGYDEAIVFYLAPPLCFTLGLRGRRCRAAGCVRAALSQLYGADQRYQGAEKWSINGRWANTGLAAFRIAPRRGCASAPTELVSARRKCPGERPGAKRGMTLEEAREQTELVLQALADPVEASPLTAAAAANGGRRVGEPASSSRAGP